MHLAKPCTCSLSDSVLLALKNIQLIFHVLFVTATVAFVPEIKILNITPIPGRAEVALLLTHSAAVLRIGAVQASLRVLGLGRTVVAQRTQRDQHLARSHGTIVTSFAGHAGLVLGDSVREQSIGTGWTRAVDHLGLF